jgi:hypothetical protein
MLDGVNFAKDYQKDLYNIKKFIEKYNKTKKCILLSSILKI